MAGAPVGPGGATARSRRGTRHRAGDAQPVGRAAPPRLTPGPATATAPSPGGHLVARPVQRLVRLPTSCGLPAWAGSPDRCGGAGGRVSAPLGRGHPAGPRSPPRLSCRRRAAAGSAWWAAPTLAVDRAVPSREERRAGPRRHHPQETRSAAGSSRRHVAGLPATGTVSSSSYLKHGPDRHLGSPRSAVAADRFTEAPGARGRGRSGRGGRDCPDGADELAGCSRPTARRCRQRSPEGPCEVRAIGNGPAPPR